MNTSEYHQMIDDFETHYAYDGTYMREMLWYLPNGFSRFNAFLPLARFREKLPAEAYWVAKLAAVKTEDCGECLQLNIRMALEDGVPKEVIEAAILDPASLNEHLSEVYIYATTIARAGELDEDLIQRIEAQYDLAQRLEFGICIATAKVFPSIKRSIGYTKSCSLMEFDI